MTRTPTFNSLRDFLVGLGFTETRVPQSHLYFSHGPTDTILLYREYRPEEKVTPGDLLTTRKFLDERGILDGDDFDTWLREAIAIPVLARGHGSGHTSSQ